jgi:glycosyl transferase, family 25
MNKLNILYINLEYRKERNEHIIEQLKSMDLTNYQRFEAIYNKECGHIGCATSHIACLEIAKKNNWEQVLIIEDDFTFTKDENYIFENYDRIKDTNWDVLMLSGNLNKANILYEKIDDTFSKCIKTATTAGYIVKDHYYDTLLNNFKESKKILEKDLEQHKIKLSKMDPSKIRGRWNATSRSTGLMLQYTCNAIDAYMQKLQDKDNWVIFYPNIGKQNELFNGNYKGNDT